MSQPSPAWPMAWLSTTRWSAAPWPMPGTTIASGLRRHLLRSSRYTRARALKPSWRASVRAGTCWDTWLIWLMIFFWLSQEIHCWGRECEVFFLRFSKSKDIKLKRRSRRLPWYCSRLHFFKLIWGRNQIWKLMKQPSGKAGKVDWLLLVFWSPHTSLVMTSLCKQYLDLCGERRVMRKHRDQLNLSLAGDWLQCGHAHRGQRRGPQPHRALPLLRQPLRVSRGGFLAELLPAHHGLQRRHVRRHGAPCRTDRRVLGSKKNHWHWFSRCSRCSMSIY